MSRRPLLPTRGTTARYEAHGAVIEVRMISATTYHARPLPDVGGVNGPSWTRFGDPDEMRADVAVFLSTGRLPFDGAGCS